MKSLKIAGLCLASMLVMSMALAGSAAAAGPLWLVCLEGTGLTKYETNQCNSINAEASKNKWQSQGLAGKSDTVKIRALTLRLADTATGATVTCSPSGSVGWGLIEGVNEGQVKVAEVTNPKTECKVTKNALIGCREGAEVTEVKGVDLPWKIKLFEKEGKILTTLLGTGVSGGEPGWKIICGGAEDRCETEPKKEESVELINEVTGGVLLIRGRFEHAEKGKCSLGGAGSGEVEGLVAILLVNGQALSINPTV